MKKENLTSLPNKAMAWHSIIHCTFITLLLILIIVLPILYTTQSQQPSYWIVTCILLGLLALIYIMYWCFRFMYIKLTQPLNDLEQQQQQHTRNNNSTSIISSDMNSLNNNDSYEFTATTLAENDYNPSTVGIPPSSFLAPTLNQQASIRSSSLDYTPPPPVYQDMIYPPSYRSTNSVKDDTNSL